MLAGMRKNGFPRWLSRTASLSAALIPALLSGSYTAHAATPCTMPAAVRPAAGHHIVPASYASKSQAILQGGQSKLDLIRMKQSSAGIAAPVALVQDVVFRAAALKIENPFLGKLTGDITGSASDALPLPQLFELPSLTAAVPLPAVRLDLVTDALPGGRCHSAPMLAAPAVARDVRHPVRPGSPDVFGSVALAVSRTSLDDKWLPAANASLGKRRGSWSGIIASARHLARPAQISAVNSWVNARISYVEDVRQYGTVDYWASAAQSLTGGRGDCEDYAIAKMQILRALGVPADSMYLVVARDLVRRVDHAVLAVALNGDLMVLDNETDRILSSADLKDYKPLLSFTATKRWTHGYRIEAPAAPVQYAALNR